MAKNNQNQEFPASCPVCRKVLSRKDVFPVFEAYTKILLHFSCPSCQTSALLTVVGGMQGTIGMGMVTDLDRAEIAEKFFGRSVSADEVIDAYQMMNNSKCIDFEDSFRN